MPDILFICPGCDKRLAVDTRGVGQTLECTDCGAPVVVPVAAAFFGCPECGAELAAPDEFVGNSASCPECDAEIQVEADEEEVPAADTGQMADGTAGVPTEKKGIPPMGLAIGAVVLVVAAFGVGLLIPRGEKPAEPVSRQPPRKTQRARQPKPTQSTREEPAAEPEPVESKSVTVPEPSSEVDNPPASKVQRADVGPVEAPTVDPTRFAGLRTTYEHDVENVREAYNSLNDGAVESYRTGLLKLQKEYEKKGDLKSWLAARIERDRIAEMPQEIRTPPPGKVEPVLKLHSDLLGSLSDNDKQAEQEITALTDAYLREIRDIEAGMNDTRQHDLKQKITAEVRRLSR